jgi:hypothetical protein
MGVRRFSDPDQAQQALWTSRNDPTLARRIRSLWRTATRLASPSSDVGIKRFHDIDEANRDRDRVIANRIRQLRERRGAQ